MVINDKCWGDHVPSWKMKLGKRKKEKRRTAERLRKGNENEMGTNNNRTNVSVSGE